jgi:hypothetical protein
MTCFLSVCIGGGDLARAESLSGVCPDGSMFIVKDASDVPCRKAKLVDPSEMPPLRPELLPNPYTWTIDQQSRDPRNPYNLIDAAEKIRALRAGESVPQKTPLATGLAQVPAPETAAPSQEAVRFSDSELRDIPRLIALRQRLAPAKLRIEDVHGREQLEIELAFSPSFEGQVLDALNESAGKQRVLMFLARSVGANEFYPNFFVVQGAMTFRPDPDQSQEVGFLIGGGGPLAPGERVLGYLLIPAKFDLGQPMDLWWNDQSVSAVLAP